MWFCDCDIIVASKWSFIETISPKTRTHSKTKQVNIVMTESLKHSVNWFNLMRIVFLRHCQLELLPIQINMALSQYKVRSSNEDQIKITKKCSESLTFFPECSPMNKFYFLYWNNSWASDMDDCPSELLPASLFISPLLLCRI